EIIRRLNTEINAVLADPALNARFDDLGGTVLAGSPADFGKLIADETGKWGEVVRAANIKAERAAGWLRVRGGNAMKLPRRQFLHLAAGAAALPIVPRLASAQTYPSRPITACIHRFRSKPFPNSLPTLRTIPARSTWRRRATEPSNMSAANCS